MLSALAAFSRPAADDKTFERFYNLSPQEFIDQLNDYASHDQIDSAMLYANIQASKYGKGNLKTDELEACCAAFRFMGYGYLFNYCNYQSAAENYMKAEQIADKYQFLVRVQIANEKAILAAMQNDLENNFAFNKDVLESFKKALYLAIDHLKKKNAEIDRITLETTAPNPLYLAIKFDKAKEVVKEVEAYREAQKKYGTSCNVTEVLCNAIEYYNAGNYDKAFEALQTPLNRPKSFNEQDYNQVVVIVKMAQYAVLAKSGKRAEALKLLLQLEQSFREQGMAYEQLEALQLIWQHHEADGNKAMADKYALQYYITKDEFINKSQMGKIDQAKLNLELEQTRERIQEMSYRQRMQTIVLWSAIIIALLALALLGVLWVNYRKTRRTNRLLYEKNVALLAANQELRPASAVAATTPDELDETDEADEPAEAAEKPANGKPTQADRELLEKIKETLATSSEVFDDGFSRQRLAELVGVNSKYVSRAINSCSQGNFNVLLNEYRIKEACRRLMDAEHYGDYTIESIGNSVGFRSRGYFAAVFKDIVGLTPSAFQKMCREGKTPNA